MQPNISAKEKSEAGKPGNDKGAVSDAAAARERNGSNPDQGGTGSGSTPGMSGSGVPPEKKPNVGEGDGPAR